MEQEPQTCVTTLDSLLKHPSYLTYKHTHSSWPGRQLVEQATKETLTCEKLTANVSLQQL